MSREDILLQVDAERDRQEAKGFADYKDDRKEPWNWHEDIESYNGWARLMWAMGSTDKARNRFIQIAALAVAAIESLDRKDG